MRTALLTLILAGCGSDTRVILTVVRDSTLRVPEDIDELYFETQEQLAPGRIELVHKQDHLVLCTGGGSEGCFPLPLTAALVPGEHLDSTIVVIIEARHQGVPVIRDAATFKFVPHSTEHLTFVLRPQCLGSDCSRFQQACGAEGQCAPLTTESGQMDGGSVATDGAPGSDGGALGDRCAKDEECGSNHCVDEVCCESTCADQCEACNGAMPGKCVAVSGPPTGGRPGCSGAGSACGGTCDGTNTAQCQYPPSTTVCGAGCAGHCDQAGSCSAAGNEGCVGGFACGAGGCLTSCAGNQDCQPNFVCNAPSCQRLPESDCLDGVDNNGDTLADCADPTCNLKVTCVPAQPAGELGLFQPEACPITNFTRGTALHQGLSSPTCSGCGCYLKTTCSLDISGYDTTDCSGTPNVTATITASNEPGNLPICVNSSGAIDPQRIWFSAYNTTQACVTTGTASAGAPSWTSTQNFCTTSRTSDTCGDSSLVCVPATAPTTPLCVRLPPATGCPGEYPVAQGSWYTGFTAPVCSCAACLKTADGNCGSPGTLHKQIDAWSQADCGGSFSGHFSNVANNDTCIEGCTSCLVKPWSALTSFKYLGNDFINAGTCSISTNTDAPAAPVGGSLVCCR